VQIEPRKRLAQSLSALGGASQLRAQSTSVRDDLNIEIVGVGPLELPVSAAQVKRLRCIARPAYTLVPTTTSALFERERGGARRLEAIPLPRPERDH